MSEDMKRMLDEAVILMRSAADFLEMEGRYVLPEAMRKWSGEADSMLEKENSK